MNRHLTLVGVALLVCLISLSGASRAQRAQAAAGDPQPGAREYRSGAVLVRFRDGVAPAGQAKALAPYGVRPEQSLSSLGVISLAVHAGSEMTVVADCGGGRKLRLPSRTIWPGRRNCPMIRRGPGSGRWPRSACRRPGT